MGDERDIGGWRVTLASMAFVLDAAKLSRMGGDLLEPLVFAAVVQANQSALRADPELDRRYAASGETLPDALRRPIAVHAVAQSLQLPFETVRRRVMSLQARGFCVLTPTGVYVPAAAIASPLHADIQAARLRRLSRFRDELAGAGFLTPGEAPPHALPPEHARVANRFLSQYMLRAAQHLIALTGGVMEGFALLGLCCENAGHLLAPDEAAQDLRAEARPCSGLGLARRLEIPRENARRHLRRLQAAGFAQGARREWFAALPPGSKDRVAVMAAENAADLHRLFGRLSEVGGSAPAAPERRRDPSAG